MQTVLLRCHLSNYNTFSASYGQPAYRVPPPLPAMTFDASNGYLGIGTSAPQAPLDVSGVLVTRDLAVNGELVTGNIVSRLSSDLSDMRIIDTTKNLSVLTNSSQTYTLPSRVDGSVEVGFEKIIFNTNASESVTVRVLNPSGSSVIRTVPSRSEARLIWLGADAGGWV